MVWKTKLSRRIKKEKKKDRYVGEDDGEASSLKSIAIKSCLKNTSSGNSSTESLSLESQCTSSSVHNRQQAEYLVSKDSETRTSLTNNSGDCAQSLDSQQVSISPSIKKCAKKVKFDTVEIREYNRHVGDHPSCSNGPPIR
jgi:hypothetical protein